MSKKSNYFSHDSNSRTDERILSVRIKFGAEGYGIYFMILENLREQANYSCVKDYNLLAFDLRVDANKIKSIIEDFGLFTFTEDGKRFYSESFNKRMEYKDEKSNKARESANKRWQNDTKSTKEDANAMRTHTKTDASKVKESKVKERKEEKENLRPQDLSKSNLFREPVIPTKDQVLEAFMQNGGNKEMAKSFWERNQATGWYFKGSPVINFKDMVYSFVTNWKKNENGKVKEVFSEAQLNKIHEKLKKGNGNN